MMVYRRGACVIVDVTDTLGILRGGFLSLVLADTGKRRMVVVGRRVIVDISIVWLIS